MKLGIDVNRHKEIIVKAISGLLLLMLKHFKLNHIYQVITERQSLGIDVNRHKEIIVKAISGLLLLMLKHFKLNHIYQV